MRSLETSVYSNAYLTPSSILDDGVYCVYIYTNTGRRSICLEGVGTNLTHVICNSEIRQPVESMSLSVFGGLLNVVR